MFRNTCCVSKRTPAYTPLQVKHYIKKAVVSQSGLHTHILYIYTTSPLKDLCFFTLCCAFYGLDSLPTMSDLVRLLTYTYILTPQTKNIPIDSCNFHASAVAAAATITTAPTTAMPQPRTNLDHVVAHVCLYVVAAKTRKHCKYL